MALIKESEMDNRTVSSRYPLARKDESFSHRVRIKHTISAWSSWFCPSPPNAAAPALPPPLFPPWNVSSISAPRRPLLVCLGVGLLKELTLLVSSSLSNCLCRITCPHPSVCLSTALSHAEGRRCAHRLFPEP